MSEISSLKNIIYLQNVYFLNNAFYSFRCMHFQEKEIKDNHQTHNKKKRKEKEQLTNQFFGEYRCKNLRILANQIQ